MAKAAKSADQIARNWQAGMASAGAKYTQGVQNVTENPAAKAATPEAMNAYVNGVQASVADGRRAAGLAKTTLQSWQAACVGKGAGRLTSGANAAAPKQLAAAQKWAPIYAQASQAADQVSKSDPLGRVRAAMNVLKSAAGKPTI